MAPTQTPAVLLLALCSLLAGCGQGKVATHPPLGLSKPTEGHVYLAELLSAHPLYPAAQRLSEEISREEREQGQAAPLASLEPWTARPLAGLSLGEFPYEAFHRDWVAWEAQLVGPPESEQRGLPPDLEAEKRWRYRQIELEEVQALAQVRAEESRRLAAIREELVRERLVELTNAGLSVQLPPGEARQKAEEIRRQIWTDIEEAVSRERQASEARLALQAERLARQSQRLKTQVDAELEEEAQARRESRLLGVEGPREEMRRGVAGLLGHLGIDSGRLERSGAEPSPTDLQEAEQARNRAFAAYQEARRRQLRRLKESRAQLIRAMLADLRLATTRVAFEHNLRLTLVPPGSPTQVDLTSQVRRHLRTIWSGRTSLQPHAEETARR